MAPPTDVSRFFRSFRTPLFIASSSASTAQAERSSVQILTGIAAVLALRIVEPLRLSASFVRRGMWASVFPRIVLPGTQYLYIAAQTRECGLP
jgi:hypothetical protein